MFFGKKHKVIVKNKNITIEARSGSNLFKVLDENGVVLPTLCDGSGQCGKCKVHILTDHIQKPTKKERLILARMSLDDGYRLACQYIIKSDIIVDTDDYFDKGDVLDSTVKVKVLKEQETSEKDNEIKEEVIKAGVIDGTEDIVSNNEISFKDDEVERFIENEIIEEPKKSKEVEIEIKKDKGRLNTDEYQLTDGILLIQYQRGIKYYIYSAGINNISSDGFVKTDETLVDLIDNNALSDFIHHSIDVDDIERVMIILNKCYYKGKDRLGLINYYAFELGTVLCEIIQPLNKVRDILTFLRLMRTNKNSLVMHLDNLSKCFYTGGDELILFDLEFITNEFEMDPLLETGKNPILDISDDFKTLNIFDEYIVPTGMSFSVLLKVLNLMSKYGIIDENYQILDKNTLIDKVPLEILVKLSSRDGTNKFYIYRKNNVEIQINQDTINQLIDLRNFMLAIIFYTEKNVGKMESITFDTVAKYENMVNEFIDLGFIPSKYAKKIIHLTGDPTVFSTNFFNEKNLDVYLNKKFNGYRICELYKDNNFNQIYDDF